MTRAYVLGTLGNAYAGHPHGEPKVNIARAQHCYQQALSEITQNNETELWLTLQINMATLIMQNESEFDSTKKK